MDRITAGITKYGTKVLTVVTTVIVFCMLVYSGYVLYDTLYTNRAAFASWDLTKYRPSHEEHPPSFAEMQKINPDTCGWVIMPDTHIDYPVVQGKDDLEYSMKDYYGENSLTGAIYLSIVNSRDFTDSFNLLYGHYMDNGAMFGDIVKYEDYEFFYSHQDGYLITTKGLYDLHVFARLSADAYDGRIYSAGDRDSSDFPEFLYYVKSLAVQWDPTMDIDKTTAEIKLYLKARNENIAENGEFVFDKMPKEAVKNGAQLIAFSTCADAVTNGRQILVATMKMRTEPLPPDLFNDDPVPLKVWGHGEADHWALLNLICLIMILAIMLPGRRIRRKYDDFLICARETLRARGEGELTDRELRFIGILIQFILVAFSVFWFVWTENPFSPMVIIDRWTLAMIFLFGLTWFVDVYLVRYQRKRKESRE